MPFIIGFWSQMKCYCFTWIYKTAWLGLWTRLLWRSICNIWGVLFLSCWKSRHNLFRIAGKRYYYWDYYISRILILWVKQNKGNSGILKFFGAFISLETLFICMFLFLCSFEKYLLKITSMFASDSEQQRDQEPRRSPERV